MDQKKNFLEVKFHSAVTEYSASGIREESDNTDYDAFKELIDAMQKCAEETNCEHSVNSEQNHNLYYNEGSSIFGEKGRLLAIWEEDMRYGRQLKL